jgi:mRNA interferase MazF
MTSYEFGEIVLVDFPQSGSAQRKKRPALVVLDIGDVDIVLAPITTRQRSGQGDYRLRDWQLSGLLRESWVRLAKIACLEKNDITRRLGRLTNYDRDVVAKLWQTLYVFSGGT